MASRNITIVSCDAPRCKASREFPRYDESAPRAAGWWVGTRRKHACPEHADEARKAEDEDCGWRKRECDARNEWVKKNPPPKHPKWLDGVF